MENSFRGRIWGGGSFFGLMALCLLVASSGLAVSAPVPFRVEVVDEDSGWPVPLVILETTHHQRFVTDNAGVVAIDLPEVMGREIWFDISSPGYDIPKDGFGSRGVRFVAQPGGTKRITIKRSSIAQRVGRLTGGGLFAESQNLGEHLDWKDKGPFGCDSVQTARFGDGLFWLWGDTNVAHYPLGIFHVTGATSELPKEADLVPPLKLDFSYFRSPKDEQGRERVRAIANISQQGPTWLWGLTSVRDGSGKERLVASYEKTAGNGSLESDEWGLTVWNEETEYFEPLKTLWKKSEGVSRPLLPRGVAAKWADRDGKKWIGFGSPLPQMRCADDFEGWSRPETWEEIEQVQALPDAASGKMVRLHTGGIAWNSWRERWVAIFLEADGPGKLGSIWYAEAKQPDGPWGAAVKVLEHDNYTFYNPVIHPEFSAEGSRYLYFEGTYTRQFTNHAQATPRYDYNQILYRIDLEDPALKEAVLRQ